MAKVKTNATKEKFGFQSLLEEAVWMSDSNFYAMQKDKEDRMHEILDLVSDPGAEAEDPSALQSRLFRDIFEHDISDEPVAQVPISLFPCP